MLSFLPMSTAFSDEWVQKFRLADEPKLRAQQLRLLQGLLEKLPEARQVLVEQGLEQGREQGLEQGLERLYERRLGRALSEVERQTLRERWGRLGADRLDAVLLDSSAEGLAAWLADPEAR
jgi:hypothetical protein